ncbi:cell envelope integrity protein TolA [Pseudoalteromonas sp. McH1-7]|uniref:cell envelope integrity protein TolA n=1 Tax=Pseudoalteromonas TaxID=53246 RepID=UPI000F64B671|nr:MULTISPECIES: cell envelope integrity protein TolA [Pseudoalteromonas]MDW7548022.1 cell envelope integrity protein TolA [Pseudoalteromonas peptidolytica]NUZ10986.1 cell envelope integrity protein TolA [Pseudoalteromonas sp. McH1-7]RRS06577.1 cell envelope integrity protein TolA [Pseudoalteromonas sp. J010]RXE94531.1 cell envelope integrity protein TolA [Pseudoalteromonas sp. PS5]USD27386.1 cell envelope integrity protein TolA [Pseudoalteromonas sp. SCSIO 43201]
MSSLSSSVVKSVLLHGAIGGLLLATANFHMDTPTVMEVTLNPQQEDKQPERVVSAVSVDQQAVEKKIADLKKREADKKAAEERRIRDLEQRAQQARKDREAEARRIKKLEQERQAKLEEKRRAEAQAKRAREIEKKQREQADKARAEKAAAEEAAKKAAAQRKAEEDRLKKAEEARKRREAEEKRKAEEAERKRQKALEEQMLREQLAKEQAARAKIRQQQVLSEVDKYKALIMQRIQANLLIDETMKGKQCRVNIRLAFNGLVTHVESLGGDRLVCEAAIRAVKMADTLPVSKEKDVFEQLKNINLTIKPNL